MSAEIALCQHCHHFGAEHGHRIGALIFDGVLRCDRCEACPGFTPRKLKIPLRLVVDNTKKGAA